MVEEKGETGFFDTLWGRIILFFLPFLIAGSYIYLLYIIMYDKSVFWIVGTGMFGYFFPPAGKESVIPLTIGALRSQFNLSTLATITLVSGSIAFVDIVTSYFLLYNFYIAKAIPYLGGWIEKFENFGAKKMKEKEWISKIAFVGVALFVFFPFQGSGGVGASILGKVIGMDKYKAWLSIILGAFVGCFMIGIISFYLSGAVLSIFKSSVFQGLGVLVVIIAMFIFFYYYLEERSAMLELKEEKNEA